MTIVDCTFVSSFQGVTLPGRADPVRMSNVDEFMKRMHELVVEQTSEDDALVARVREVVAKMDYKTLVN